MKFKQALLICSLLYLTNCGHTSKKQNDTQQLKIERINPSKDKKELIVQERCAVIYSPDSKKIDLLKQESEEAFYTAADDAMNYISKTREFLEKQQVKILETKASNLNFYINGKSFKRFRLSGRNKTWGVILFNGVDKAIESDLTNIEPDFEKVLK